MIDLHTHILCGLDDGSCNIRTSLDMLKALSIEGIRGVVCTPHVTPLRTFDNSMNQVRQQFDALQKASEIEGINIKLYFGAEIDEHDDLERDIALGFTINHTKHVLIDFGMREADISSVIYELNILGYQTIVAHPERYDYLSLKQLIQLKKEGAIFQITAKNLLKPRSKSIQKRARYLLKNNLIDVIASDMHAIRHAKSMSKAYQYVLRKKGKSVAEALFNHNPRRILGITD